MGVIAKVELLLDVGLDKGADGVNELLRELQRKFTDQSCLVDYAVLGFRVADAATVASIPKGEYEEGLAFSRRPSEVEGLASVSTAHLSEQGREWIEGGMEGVVGYPNENGAFMYTGSGWELTADGVPPEVVDIVAWAREQGLTWVKFDGDGAVVGCLTQFE